MRISYLSADRGIPMNGTKGASAHVRGLVRAFQDLGHEVTLVAPRDGDAGDSLPGTRFVPITTPRSTGISLERMDASLARALGHLWNNVGTEEALNRAWSSGLPDILYERLSPFGVAGGFLARELGLFHVLEVNSPLAWEGARYRRQALPEAARALEQETMASAALIVAVSGELRDTLTVSGVPAGKIEVVPNGVDPEAFTPEGARAYPELAGNMVVGFVGSLKPWHGIGILVDAFDRLAADPRYHLLVVGTGPEERLIAGASERHPGRVTLTGAMDHKDVPRHLRAVDIAVAPYPDLEAFYFSPLKVLEYMAAGRAVVAAAAGQIPSLLADGVTGILVPPGDPAALAEAIRSLGEDPVRRRELGRAARDAAVASHRWTDRASRILDLVAARRPC